MAQEQQLPQQQQQGQMQVKISDETLKGAYANMVQVAHTPEEFVLDFMNLFPPAGSVVSRIFVSPAHMKRLVAAMQDNIKKYEEQFGAIKASEGPNHQFGFRTE